MRTDLVAVPRLALVLIVACCAALTGCAGGPGKYNVTVKPGDGLTDSFVADLIAVSDTDLDEWKGLTAADYFTGRDNHKRDDAEKGKYKTTLDFDGRSPAPKTLSKKDPIWKTWMDRGASSLVVFVNLSGVKSAKVLPLDRDRWSGDTIELLVQSSGISPQNLKPAK